MKAKHQKIKVKELVAGFINKDEEGVYGFSGHLNIRPPYQREFIYDRKKKEAVIRSIKNNMPLNIMYWVKNNDEEFELLDGQQRTMSICDYVIGDFSVDHQFFHNLSEKEKENIEEYELDVYICEGSDDEKLAWFQTINIANVPLNNQEIRNAIYTGKWLFDAKARFAKSNCSAYNVGKDYLEGNTIRQDFLETTLKWISDSKGIKIEEYMAKHQHDNNANELWDYFVNVIEWVKSIFPQYRKIMDGLPWGIFYNKYKNKALDPVAFEEEIKKLLLDVDIKKPKGIYEYLLSGNEKALQIRTFNKAEKIKQYEKQQGFCNECRGGFTFNEMQGDHITPWSKGGKTETSNLQMLCGDCNRKKGGK